MKIKINLKSKKISNVSIGDYVYCYDEYQEKYGVNEVNNIFTPTIKKEYQEKIDIDTETVYTSSIHPFYDFSNKKWVESQEIDEINGLDHFGNLQLLKNDINYQSTEDKTFYDFTVNNYHNYFVGKNNKFVLTHNSATVFFPIWHQEIEDIIVLKNNKGTEDNRVRKLDYGIQISKIFYERFIRNEEITLFSPHDVLDLYDAFGTDRFDDLYVGYERNKSIPRKTIGAQELFLDLLKERAETGRIYIMNIDHCNSHSSFVDKVYMSNLCVAGDTKILTKDGYQTISEMVGDYVDIWNGENWSNVLIEKTSDNQELLKVVIDSEEIECTPYHRFFIIDGKNYSRDKKLIEKRAYELKSGDKLIKFDLPIIEGELELGHAYALGFHSGDGSYSRGLPIVDLYGPKKNILEYLPYSKYYNTQDKIRVYLDIPSHTKFIVPNCDYTIESRLKWFAGLVDSDGHITKNNQTETIQISSINCEFLKNIKYMLQELGIDCKIKKTYEDRMQFMPDGKGGMGEYNCKEAWRLLISNSGLSKLCNLGFSNYVLNSNISGNIPNRNAERFHIVDEIVYTGRRDSTYCFTEPFRGMGMFNGFLLGNCMEITLPTIPLQHIDNDGPQEIATCILSALNVGKIKSDEELEELCDLAVRGLEELIDYQDYPVKAAENFTKRRRALGVGFIGLAHYLAKLGFNYDSQEAWDAVHTLSESFQYFLLKSSLQIAKEKGPCQYFNRTKYAHGILPIDTYKKDVDELSNPTLQHDWETLREDIKLYGIRHSTLSAQMPSESCLFWEHKIKTQYGYINFHEICEKNDIDWETVENTDAIGWYNLKNPIEVETQEGYKGVDKLYFNGNKEVVSITFDNGKVIKCTPNHRFLVNNVDGTTIWKRVYELCENDDVVEF